MLTNKCVRSLSHVWHLIFHRHHASQQEVLLSDEGSDNALNIDLSDTWSLSSDTLDECSQGDYMRLYS